MVWKIRSPPPSRFRKYTSVRAKFIKNLRYRNINPAPRALDDIRGSIEGKKKNTHNTRYLTIIDTFYHRQNSSGTGKTSFVQPRLWSWQCLLPKRDDRFELTACYTTISISRIICMIQCLLLKTKTLSTPAKKDTVCVIYDENDHYELWFYFKSPKEYPGE